MPFVGRVLSRNMSGRRRGGGTGRRTGLKILDRESDVWVRFPPPALAFARLASFGEAGPSLALRTSARQVRHAGAIRASVFKADLAFALLKAFQSLSAR